MTQPLGTDELVNLVHRVFGRQPDERALAILVDLPDAQVPDTDTWRERRQLAAGWAETLAKGAQAHGIEAHLYHYRNVGLNNADLPATAQLHSGGALPQSANDLRPDAAVPFSEIFARHRMIMAPTQLSATAPLKLAARQHGFRAATMPGFTASMVDALRLDYVEINRRVQLLTGLLDAARHAELRFVVDGEQPHELRLDLRHRSGHASGGLMTSPGTAGNLPSGEAYIVPYEGEQGPSETAGALPVQLENEVVVYRIEHNRASDVTSDGPVSAREAQRLRDEPAYGNLAELGLGVLGDFGLQPCGVILLDEKLGLHIAFGRSDHFGGQVGAKDFSSPQAVVHIDRVYLPSTQPRVRVEHVTLHQADGSQVALIRDDRFVVDFGR